MNTRFASVLTAIATAVLVVSLSACATPAGAPAAGSDTSGGSSGDPAAWVVDDTRMGPLAVGMTADEARAAQDGLPFEILEGYGDGELSVLVVEADGVLGMFQVRIDRSGTVSELTLITGETSVRTVYGSMVAPPGPQLTLSAFPRTDAGIGIGSTFEDVREAYPEGGTDDLFGGDGATDFVTGGARGSSPVGLVLGISSESEETLDQGTVDSMTVIDPRLAVPYQVDGDPSTWHASGYELGPLWPGRPWQEIVTATGLPFAPLADGAEVPVGPRVGEVEVLPIVVDGRRGDIVAYLDGARNVLGSAVLFTGAPLETATPVEPVELDAMPYGLEGLTIGATLAEVEDLLPGGTGGTLPHGGRTYAPFGPVAEEPILLFLLDEDDVVFGLLTVPVDAIAS